MIRGSLLHSRFLVHYAVNCSYYNSIDALTCLIENGADVNARTYHDQTPLMIADQIQGRSFPKYVDRSFHHVSC